MKKRGWDFLLLFAVRETIALLILQTLDRSNRWTGYALGVADRFGQSVIGNVEWNRDDVVFMQPNSR